MKSNRPNNMPGGKKENCVIMQISITRALELFFAVKVFVVGVFIFKEKKKKLCLHGIFQALSLESPLESLLSAA